MRSIKTLLEREGFNYLLTPRPLVNIKPIEGEDFCEYMFQLMADEDRRVLIIPDIDIDGYFSAKIMFDTFKYLGIEAPRVYLHPYSHHGLTSSMAMWILQKKYTHVIVVDSSSNELESISLLCMNGVRVCILDHHICNYSMNNYPKLCKIFNNILHMKEGYKLPYKCASCGLITALYCNYVLSRFGKTLPSDLWTFAAVTLYSDCMDTLDPFNVSVLNAVRLKGTLPVVLQKISGKKIKDFNRDIVTYSINPKINSCLRLERFDLIYRLLFVRVEYSEELKIYDTIHSYNRQLKEYLGTLEGELPIVNHGYIASVNMTALTKSVYTNFKGLLANKIGEQLGKLTIGYYIIGHTVYGSVRDPMSREILPIFREYCYAEGHMSAFGFEIDERKFDGLIDYVQRSLDELDKKPKKPIIIGENEYSLDDASLKQLSIVNEYTTVNHVLVRIRINPEKYAIRSTRYGYQITSSNLRMSSNIPVSYGNVVLAAPVYGTTTKLHIKTLGG